MLKALFTSATGMKAQQIRVDNISHNLANANTSGFKKGMVDFQDLIYVNLGYAGGTPEDNAGIQIGSGSKVVSAAKIHSQGVLEQTGRELDISIQGEGFFQITLPNGDTAYTRDGSFKLDSNRNLVTSTGCKLSPAITIPAQTTSIRVAQDGTVSAVVGNQTQNVGQITLAVFSNASGLSSEGGNVFLQTPASGAPTTGNPGDQGIGVLNQGFLERSNVEIVDELVNLIIAQRAYEINSRAIKTGDEMLATVNELSR